MAHGFIRYDQMMENALRGIIRDVLRLIEKKGLVGGHHFYISFKTRYPGVSIPDFLLEKYPEEMTIVMQHQFWDLIVKEDLFSLTLSFSKIPCNLVIPFAAVTGFADPSVEFGLQFHTEVPASDDVPAAPAVPSTASESPAKEKTTKKSGGKAAVKDENKVVSLDSFRKKKK